MSLEAALQKWAKTAQGQAKLQASAKEALRTGNAYTAGAGGGDGSNQHTPAFYAETLKNMIQTQISMLGYTFGQSLAMVDIGYNDASGAYEVHLNFDRAEIHRESLNPEEYASGIENIVALFNNGMHARDYVYGWWEGHRPTGEAIARSITGDEPYAWVRSERDRYATLFMQEAVDAFNSLYGKNAIATLSQEYWGNWEYNDSW